MNHAVIVKAGKLLIDVLITFQIKRISQMTKNYQSLVKLMRKFQKLLNKLIKTSIPIFKL